MTSKWLSVVLLVVVVACGTGVSDEGSSVPPSSTTSLVAPTTSESTTTSSSPTTTSSTLLATTTSESATKQLVLASDGLGIVSLGDPVDEVLLILVGRFGPPTHDWLHESPFDVPAGWEGETRGPDACHAGTNTGHVCFDYLRTVGWNDAGLYVLFSDITVNPEARTSDDFDDYWVEVEPGLQGYGYRGGEGPLLGTTDGITIGSTTSDLLTLGDRVVFWWNECGGGLEFRILDPGVPTDQSIWTEGFIWGSLDDGDFEHFEETGLPHEGAVVKSLGIGQRSSC